MNKVDMREWVSALEWVIDNKLIKWKKEPRLENGEAVQLRWQFLQTHLHLDIFWEDKQESVNLVYLSPRINHWYHWHELNDKTFNKVMDRVGNLAMGAMHPVIDPTD